MTRLDDKTGFTTNSKEQNLSTLFKYYLVSNASDSTQGKVYSFKKTIANNPIESITDVITDELIEYISLHFDEVDVVVTETTKNKQGNKRLENSSGIMLQIDINAIKDGKRYTLNQQVDSGNLSNLFRWYSTER